jgi:hypothetical protein
MFYLLQTFMGLIAQSRILDAIDACLTHGVNILALDSCRCACSSHGGCLAVEFCTVGQLDLFRLKVLSRFIWTTELLSTLEEHGGEELVKTLLLYLLRREYFDDLKLTHICCCRHCISLPIPHPPELVEIGRALDEEECGSIKQLD